MSDACVGRTSSELHVFALSRSYPSYLGYFESSSLVVTFASPGYGQRTSGSFRSAPGRPLSLRSF